MENEEKELEQFERQQEAFRRREEFKKTALGLAFLIGIAALILAEVLQVMGFDKAAKICAILTIPFLVMLCLAGMGYVTAGVMFFLTPGFMIAEMIEEKFRVPKHVAVPAGFIIYFGAITVVLVALIHRPSVDEYSSDCLLPGRYGDC